MKKKLIAAIALLMVALPAYAVYHNGQLAGETEGQYGQTFCQWYCDGYGHGGAHSTVTKSYGYCPRP